MTDFLSFEQYKETQVNVNRLLSFSVGQSNASLQLFKSVLLDAISANHINDALEDNTTQQHPMIDNDTQTSFAANDLSYQRQNSINARLNKHHQMDMHLINSMYPQVLSFKDDAYYIEDEVLSNMPKHIKNDWKEEEFADIEQDIPSSPIDLHDILNSLKTDSIL